MTDHHRTGFDRRLADLLAGATAVGPCPDAEILAAYADRALGPVEHQSTETHVASCQRCQTVMAQVVADVEPDAQTVAGAVGAAGKVVPFRWKRVAAVAGPVALAASVAMAVWIGQRSQTVAPAAIPASGAQPRATELEQSSALRQSAADEARLVDRDRARDRAADQTSLQERTARSAAAAPATPVAAAPAPPLTASQQAARPVEGRARSEAMETERAERTEEQRAKANATSDAAQEFRAPSGQSIWRLEPGGAVLRTTRDASESYHLGDTLTAGAAWSDRVAWVVGTRGSVWRTTDGATWSRLPAPADEDLVSVSLTGADAAQVRTRSGRTFVTTDAGRHWTAVR